MGLLDGGIANIVGGAVDFLMLDGTLRRENVASLDSRGNPVAASPAYTSYAFRGFDDEYDAAYRARAGIPETDIKITVVGTSIETVPIQSDRLYLRGVWYQARRVETDPARAVYEIQAFKVDAP